MKSIQILAALLLCFIAANAQTSISVPPGQVKEWKFPVSGGELMIALFSFSKDGNTRLSISLTTLGPSSSPTVKEEGENLRTVIAEMQSLGFDPKLLQSIHMSILEPDTLELLQLAARNSEDWRQCVGAHNCGGGQIALRLLRQSHAYDYFNEALASFGLQVELTYLETFVTKRVRDPIYGKSDSTCKKTMILPLNALLEFSVHPREVPR